MRGVFERPDSSCSRGDTAHAPLIQVATPSLGKTQRFKTIQATTNPIITKNFRHGLLPFQPLAPRT